MLLTTMNNNVVNTAFFNPVMLKAPSFGRVVVTRKSMQWSKTGKIYIMEWSGLKMPGGRHCQG